MRLPDNSKLLVSFQVFKNATTGEVDRVLNESLKAAGYGFTVGALHCERQRNGEAIYRHPNTNEPIITLRNHGQKSFSQRGEWNPLTQQMDYITFNELNKTYTIFNEKGHITSRVKTATLSVAGVDNVECVKEIKEYYPPSKKQIHSGKTHVSKNLLAAEFRESDRQRSKDRKLARERKKEDGLGVPGMEETNDFSYDDTSVSAHEDATPRKQVRGLHGKLRREREFNIPQLADCMYRGNIPDKTKYILKKRLSKDIVRHHNGHYTAIQYSGNYYNVVEYDSMGIRLGQTTYNDLGEAVKEAGKSTRSYTLPKIKRPKPTDRDGAERAARKMLKRQAHELARVQNTDDAWEVDNKAKENGQSPTDERPKDEPATASEPRNTVLSNQIARTMMNRRRKWGKEGEPITYFSNDPSRGPHRR